MICLLDQLQCTDCFKEQSSALTFSGGKNYNSAYYYLNTVVVFIPPSPNHIHTHTHNPQQFFTLHHIVLCHWVSDANRMTPFRNVTVWKQSSILWVPMAIRSKIAWLVSTASDQFKMGYQSGKPTCAPLHISQLYLAVPLKQFQCWCGWWMPSLSQPLKVDSQVLPLSIRLSYRCSLVLHPWLCACRWHKANREVMGITRLKQHHSLTILLFFFFSSPQWTLSSDQSFDLRHVWNVLKLTCTGPWLLLPVPGRLLSVDDRKCNRSVLVFDRWSESGETKTHHKGNTDAGILGSIIVLEEVWLKVLHT